MKTVAETKAAKTEQAEFESRKVAAIRIIKANLAGKLDRFLAVQGS